MRLPTRVLTGTAVLLAAAMAFTGCAGGASAGDGTGDGEKPVVLTTFTVLADIARNDAGDHLTV